MDLRPDAPVSPPAGPPLRRAAQDARPDTLMPRPPGGTAQGVAMSLLVHGGLVAALAWGVAWRAPPPVSVSAELWAAVPQQAAPPAEQAPPPAPAPAPPPPPAPPPAPAPAPAPPPPPKEADIALEKAKQQKAQQDKAAERAEQAEKAARDKALKAEKDKADKDKAAKEKQAREAAQRQREEAAEEKRLAQQREENLKRMMGQIPTGSGAPGSRGTAAVDAAPSKEWAGLVYKAIRPNIIYPDQLPAGNPEAVVEVRVAPTGIITSRRLAKSSGSKEWDEAVLRAIDRTGSLPRDSDGRVPLWGNLVFRPRDQP